MPEELEAEEDLGPVEEEVEDELAATATAALRGLTFEVEVFGEAEDTDEQSLSESESDSESESESELEEMPMPPVRVGRVRRPNVLLGSVKKGKYSK